MPKRVPLHAVHEELGARFTTFSGYEMPLQYEGIVAEHEAVRTDVGVFDVSHMGNLWIRDDAADVLARCTVADAREVPEGRARYTVVLRDDATILDDTIFWHTPDGFHLVPNAGRDGTVAAWLTDHGARVDNATGATCILALQGPRAEHVMAEVAPDATDLGRFGCRFAELEDVRALVSRTGYTGEDGFEVICPADGAEAIHRRLVAEGAAPCGLGARDTLRLEMGYCLAGHEFAGGRTPLEANLGWLVDWDHDFVGRKRLVDQRDGGVDERLVGLVVEDGVPREGHEVRADGTPVGEVTSGTRGPTVGTGIALAYVETEHSKVDTELAVMARGRPRPARVVEPPFLERG